MDIIIWILVGALAGWIASMIMKTDGSMGPIANIVVGIVGAFLGGWILNVLNVAAPTPGQPSVPGILTAILGAVVLLGVLKAVTGRRVV